MPFALDELAWSGRLDSNQRPDAPEAPALPAALRPDYTNLSEMEIKMAPAMGFEPMTFCSTGRRSNQLRYTGE